jgi:hypothetical protein
LGKEEINLQARVNLIEPCELAIGEELPTQIGAIVL